MTTAVDEKDAPDAPGPAIGKLGNAERWACALLALSFIGGFACNVSDRGVVTAFQAGIVCAIALVLGFLALNLVGLIVWGIHAACTFLLVKAYALAGEDFRGVKLSKGAKLVLSILSISFLAGFACNISDKGVVTAFQAGVVCVAALILGFLFLTLAALIIWGVSAGIKALIRAG